MAVGKIMHWKFWFQESERANGESLFLFLFVVCLQFLDPNCGGRLCQNAFQAIPEQYLFDAEKHLFRAIFAPKNEFSVWFSRSYGRSDLKISSCVNFCFRCTRPEICTINNNAKFDCCRAKSQMGTTKIVSTNCAMSFLIRWTKPPIRRGQNWQLVFI